MIIKESKIIDYLENRLDVEFSPSSPYPPEILKGSQQSAAVLIPFLIEDGAWKLLFIRRTKNINDKHGGQVAFPGGKCDPIDQHAEAAALRETHEEVGILPKHVKILGSLNDTLTITNYRVTPIVGRIQWPYRLDLDTKEVRRAFTIPLLWLSEKNNYEVRERRLPGFNTPLQVIYYQPYDGEILWGATARIVLSLLEVLRL